MEFAISRQINKQKYAKTVNLLCAGNKVFVKYQAQGRLTPTPLRTPLVRTFCFDHFTAENQSDARINSTEIRRQTICRESHIRNVRY